MEDKKHMHKVLQIYYRETGMGIGQTFEWNREKRIIEAEDEEGRLQKPLVRPLTEIDTLLMDSWHYQFNAEEWRNYPSSEWGIVDGTEWFIRVTTEEGTEEVFRSNVFPPGWEEVRELLYDYFDAGINKEDEEWEEEWE